MTQTPDIHFLQYKAYQLRRLSLMATTAAGSGHPTSCLSAADLVAALFFYGLKFYDPCHVKNLANDHFILSKGHAAPVLYAAWKEMGAITEAELLNLRKFDSNLEGHPTPRFPFSEAATGSLGQGLSIGLGIALSTAMDQRETFTYVLLGDSELTEGSVWEAVELAARYKTERLIAILDCNRLGQSNVTIHGHDMEAYLLKFGAFGWRVLEVDGHNMQEIVVALDQAREVCGMPTIILAKTRKGHGLPATIEDQPGYHGKAFSVEQLPALLAHLEKQFPHSAQYARDHTHKEKPLVCKPVKEAQPANMQVPHPMYRVKEKLATRKAYGEALALLGAGAPQVVALDAEVKNSTYAEIFEQAFPHRFVECYIAEQNMVGMAVGFAHTGKIPFVSTFGCFFTRAHDQIRMAAIGNAPLRLVGSHAGVSIGEDGPSQMALEDIAMMRAVPNSVVLYPCDAVSAYKLVACMANYHEGISYLRITRAATAIVYDNCQEFKIGGLNVLRHSDNDQICLVAAGITVFEALVAHERLAQAGIMCRVIDCYSIKPLPEAELAAHLKGAGNKMITIEDHYREGGIGEAIVYALRHEQGIIDCLAVTKMPRSGSPEALLAYEEIDANAIVARVKQMLA